MGFGADIAGVAIVWAGYDCNDWQGWIGAVYDSRVWTASRLVADRSAWAHATGNCCVN